MTQDEIKTRFTYHSPKGGQSARYDHIRNTARGLADVINNACPESCEKDIAMARLEEAVMWANAAIARRED